MSTLLGYKVKANRSELLSLRKRQALARRAHNFLEEKHALLAQELENIRGTLLPLEQKLTNDTAHAYALLSKALISYGASRVYTAAISVEPNDRVEIRWSRVRGITVPRFENLVVSRTPLDRGYAPTGTGCGIDDAALELEECLRLLVSVAELQSVTRIIEEEMKRARTLSLALEKILIPRIQHEIRRVIDMLEEHEREQHQRTKWVLKTASESFLV